MEIKASKKSIRKRAQEDGVEEEEGEKDEEDGDGEVSAEIEGRHRRA